MTASFEQQNKTPYFLGIDGGGSKCKAVILDYQLNVLGLAVSGPANPFHGFDKAINEIMQATELALKEANINELDLSQLIVGMGLAGVNLPSVFNQVANWQHPFKKMYLTTDLHIAELAAHNGQDGAIIITGTGSCGYALVNGKMTIVGGHGFPHGDLASGAWLGFTAVQKVLLSLDGFIAPTSLTDKLFHYLAVDNALSLIEKIAHQPAAFFAKLANLVFIAASENDQIALTILKDAEQYLVKMSEQLFATGAQRLSFIGGLADKFVDLLPLSLQKKLVKPIHLPEIGAGLFAKQQLAIELNK